jgi:hypothetical protein
MVLLDSMLLSLFVVGTASRLYITKHKRLLNFREEDFDLLIGNVSQASGLLLTPNTLTETANWVKMIGEPARSDVASTFQAMVVALEESYVPSRDAVLASEFGRLWLTDAAILSALANGHILLTTDFALYDAALRRGLKAINFNDLRSLSRVT